MNNSSTSSSERPRLARDAWRALAVAALGLAALEGGFRVSPLAAGLVAENLYLAKVHAFETSPRGADIAFTGDSRVLHGVDPSVVAAIAERERGERVTVFNAGLSGAPPMAQLAWVRRFLAHPHRPRLVVMGLSPYMFSSRIARIPSRESLTTLYRLGDLPAVVRAGGGLEELSTLTLNGLFQLVRLRPRVLEVLSGRSRVGPPSGLGVEGFIAFGPVPPAIQDARARHRGRAYRTEMWKPAARFGNEQIGYFVEALRSLREAGISVLVMNTPSATQIELAYGPQSIYDEHIQWVRQTCERFGAYFADVKRLPGLPDSAYVDGDHLSRDGARYFTEAFTREHLLRVLGPRQMELKAQRGRRCPLPGVHCAK